MKVEFDLPNTVIGFCMTVVTNDTISPICLGRGDPDWADDHMTIRMRPPENAKDVKENGDD